MRYRDRVHIQDWQSRQLIRVKASHKCRVFDCFQLKGRNLRKVKMVRRLTLGLRRWIGMRKSAWSVVSSQVSLTHMML